MLRQLFEYLLLGLGSGNLFDQRLLVWSQPLLAITLLIFADARKPLLNLIITLLPVQSLPE